MLLNWMFHAFYTTIDFLQMHSLFKNWCIFQSGTEAAVDISVIQHEVMYKSMWWIKDFNKMTYNVIWMHFLLLFWVKKYNIGNNNEQKEFHETASGTINWVFLYH